MNNNRFSLKITIFHGIKAPEEGHLVGYAALKLKDSAIKIKLDIGKLQKEVLPKKADLGSATSLDGEEDKPAKPAGISLDEFS